MIYDEKDFLESWYADDRNQCERHVYKYTSCGAWVDFDNPYGIQFGSIVEGSDLSVTGEFLYYPFSSEQQDRVIQDIETLCSLEWHRANHTCIVCDEYMGDDVGGVDDYDAEYEPDWIALCSPTCANDFYNEDQYARFRETPQNAEFSW